VNNASQLAADQTAAPGPVPVPAPTSPQATHRDENDFPFAVDLGGVYEGPLDLLLDLIRKQDINIYDIPIARITAQYLVYVERIKQLDVNIAAEFIYMAAVLIEDAVAAGPARARRRRGRSAQRAGQPPAGAREVQVGGADAPAEAAD
jgi:hypothetical protein